ncbi:MAG: hypothetical protein ACREKM_12025 [Longimicrobiales bacterium]
MSTESFQLLLSLGGLLAALVGLPLLYVQLRDVKRALRSGTHAAIYEQAANVRAHLIEYPHLRRYFFEGVDITPEHEDYDRVVTIAEVFLNYLEHIAVLGDSFGRENRPALDRFTRIALQNSPILRRHLREHRDAYSDSLHRYLETDA